MIALLQRISFYLACVAVCYGLAWITVRSNVEGESLEQMFGGVAYALGGLHALTFVIIKAWADVAVGDGLRRQARTKLYRRLEYHRNLATLRLIIGFVSSILLRCSAAFLLDSKSNLSEVWLTACYASTAIAVITLVFAVIDYRRSVDLTSKLKEWDGQDQKQKAELERLTSE